MKKIEIENLLDKFNISVDILGYKYLIKAIEIYTKEANIKIAAIYGQVAKEYNSTACRVERAIRHSIESNEERIKQYFKVDYKITNKRFLSLVVREMERR